MTHRDDHDMHDIAMSMPQINVDDNEFDDSQVVDMCHIQEYMIFHRCKLVAFNLTL